MNKQKNIQGSLCKHCGREIFIVSVNGDKIKLAAAGDWRSKKWSPKFEYAYQNDCEKEGSRTGVHEPEDVFITAVKRAVEPQ